MPLSPTHLGPSLSLRPALRLLATRKAGLKDLAGIQQGASADSLVGPTGLGEPAQQGMEL